MSTSGIYSREELAKLRRELEAGTPPSCPQCGLPLEPRPVLPPDGVGYVRRRIWWICPSCHRSAVMDQPGGTP